MAREFLDDDRLRDRKRAILARINRKYNSNAGSLESINKYTKLHPINSVSGSSISRDSDSILSSSLLPHTAGGDSKEEYIEKLKKRIKQLEHAPIERLGSSRFDFDSDVQDSPPAQRKHSSRYDKRDQKSPPIKSLKSNSQPSASDHSHHSKSKNPPNSPPISASGSYDLSKYKTLGPIPTESFSVASKSVKSLQSSISSKVSSIIPESDPNMQLKQCDICSRKFRIERLEKHREACESSRKKRSVFDEKKMRIRGTELETFKKAPEHPEDASSFKPKKGAKSKAKVPKQHTSIYAHPIDDELTPCRHCGRKFSESSFEKHEKICSSINAKPKREIFRVRPV